MRGPALNFDHGGKRGTAAWGLYILSFGFDLPKNCRFDSVLVSHPAFVWSYRTGMMMVSGWPEMATRQGGGAMAMADSRVPPQPPERVMMKASSPPPTILLTRHFKATHYQLPQPSTPLPLPSPPPLLGRVVGGRDDKQNKRRGKARGLFVVIIVTFLLPCNTLFASRKEKGYSFGSAQQAASDLVPLFLLRPCYVALGRATTKAAGTRREDSCKILLFFFFLLGEQVSRFERCRYLRGTLCDRGPEVPSTGRSWISGTNV